MLALTLLGHERVRNFDASFTAWANDSRTPGGTLTIS
jgi:3-mercaptopyruvate sulfurtransferase SseA